MRIQVSRIWFATAVATLAILSTEAQDFCRFSDDTCEYQYDGECDVDIGFCPEGTDCFDCCDKHSFTSCEACTEAKCFWCAANAFCIDADTPLPGNMDCLTEEMVFDSCPANENPFPDPLFDAMDWVYSQINVKPAWAAGFTGSGVYIRINDDGVDASNAEFSGRFDVASSCMEYLPETEDNDHGTHCAAIAAASANDVCSVGIAPDAFITACSASGNISSTMIDYVFSGKHFFDESIENMDVSSNSYGRDGCERTAPDEFGEERSLQTATCPFSPDPIVPAEVTPCSQTTDCAGADWGNRPGLSEECKAYIIGYCLELYEYDSAGCSAFLDLFVECEYNGLTDEDQASLTRGVTEGRGGKGVIYVFSAGNEYDIFEDVNTEGYLNSRFTITVGAVGKDGKHASYSSTGAALFMVAPGGDVATSFTTGLDEHLTNVVVTQLGGGCGDATVGTSFSTPVVSGVVALMLQANPNLGWRDVQGILATTSQTVQEDDPSWSTNAAGLSHSYKYGFGIVDAFLAVTTAQSWKNYSPEVQLLAESGLIDLVIPQYPLGPVSSSVVVEATDSFQTESVAVYLDLEHSSRGDLDIILTSPSGTESLLHPGRRPESSQTESWKLMTVRHWNEPASGEWSLRIIDRSEGVSASRVDDSLISWRLIVYGHGGVAPTTSDAPSSPSGKPGNSNAPSSPSDEPGNSVAPSPSGEPDNSDAPSSPSDEPDNIVTPSPSEEPDNSVTTSPSEEPDNSVTTSPSEESDNSETPSPSGAPSSGAVYRVWPSVVASGFWLVDLAFYWFL